MEKNKNITKWWSAPTKHYFQKSFAKKTDTIIGDEKIHLLNQEERAALHKIELNTIIIASLLGAAGVIFLYIPYYIFPFFFDYWMIPIPYLKGVQISVFFTIYGLILAVLEIVGLTILNMEMVVKIAKICNFPNKEDANYERNIKILYEVSIEKQPVELLDFGINPLEGLSKTQIFLFTLWNKIKASLSNMITKVILGRVLGRYIVRYGILKYFIDFVSLPIFAFWNAYTSKKVIREAKIRVMAPQIIDTFTQDLKNKLYHNDKFKAVLLDTLRFISIAKRSFHHNHYLLAEKIVHYFELEIKKDRQKLSIEDLLNDIQTLDKEARVGLAKLFILGMLIDGYLSKRDWQILKALDKEDDLIDFDYQDLKHWENDFINGKGLDGLLNAQLQKK